MRQAAVETLQCLSAVEPLDHRVAYPVVIGLDLLRLAGTENAGETGAAQDGDRSLSFLAELGRLTGRLEIDRLAGHRDHLEQPPGLRWAGGRGARG